MKKLLTAITAIAVGVALSAQTPPKPAPTVVPTAATKLFAVHFTTGPAWDTTKSPAQQAHFREHSANLARLRKAGVLVLGARYADKGMILLRVADESTVHAELVQDPSIAAGVFKAQIDEFRPFYHGSTQPAAAIEQ